MESNKDSEILEKDQIKLFSQKRVALENLVRFCAGLKHITASLKAAIRMAKTDDAAKQDLKIYSALTDKIATLPIGKIRMNIHSIDARIVEDIEQIVEISGTEFDEIPVKYKHLIVDTKQSVFEFLESYLGISKNEQKWESH